MKKISTIAVAVSILLIASMFIFVLPTTALAAGPVVDYAVPTPNSQPNHVCAGPDGNLWFTEYNGNRIGRMTTTGTDKHEYAVPTAASGPNNIIAGPDGNLWFTEDDAPKIGKITTSGNITEYTIPATPSDSGPYGIVWVPSDNAFWFTMDGTNRIGRMTLAGSVTVQHAVPTANSSPYGICLGPDGNIWFVELYTSKVCKFIISTETFKEYATTTPNSYPPSICAGPDGALWFTEDFFGANHIGRITTAGAITEYDIPSANSAVWGICAGPDGALWFAEYDTNKIGRCTTGGVMTEYIVPTSASRPNKTGVGPDGRIWFTEWDGNKIGVLSPPYPTWYLAEGTTAWGFSDYFTIENPNSSAVNAKVTYMTSGGLVAGPTVALPGMSQATVFPKDTLGEKDFSTKVECTDLTKTIAVDRTMTWPSGYGNGSGEHSSVGVTYPAMKWYLPEGSSAWGFECWLLIQNPNAKAANCRVTYMIEGGAPVTKTKTIGANSRQSFNMKNDIGEHDASIMVESTNVPVIPERAMYQAGPNMPAGNRREGHDSIGTTAPATDYFLAEGRPPGASPLTSWCRIPTPLTRTSRSPT